MSREPEWEKKCLPTFGVGVRVKTRVNHFGDREQFITHCRNNNMRRTVNYLSDCIRFFVHIRQYVTKHDECEITYSIGVYLIL